MDQNLKTSWGLCFILLIFIFSPILSTQETAQPGALYVIFVAVPLFIMANNKHLIKGNNISIYAILLFVFALISTAISELGNFRVGSMLKYLLLILIFICSNSIVLTPRQLKFSFKAYLLLSIAISSLIILSFIFGYPHTASDYYQGRYSIGITGLYKNPNYLTSFYNTAFFVICYLIATVNIKRKTKYLLISILALFVISSYFTGTRAALVLEILIISTVILVVTPRRHFFKIIPILLIAHVLVVRYIDEIDLMMAYYLGDRGALEDESRSDAWALAFDYIKNNPFIGCGHNSWYKIHGTNHLEWLHNIFLELVLDQGLVGLLLIIGIISTGFKKTNVKDRPFLILFFIFYSIPMAVQNGLYEVHFWRYIIINRLLMNFSSSYEGGICTFMKQAFSTNQKVLQ